MTDKTSASQPNKKLKLYVGVASLIALSVFMPASILVDFPEIAGPVISYDHLSGEETEPFLKLGIRPMDMEPSSQIKKKYVDAVKRWPDVRSCLVRSERSKETPDLRKINWWWIRTETAIEVCMFRIFTSLGTPEKAKAWFEAQGLHEVEIRQNNGRVVKDQFLVDQKSISVTAGNLPKHTGEVYVSTSIVTALLIRNFLQGESFGVKWIVDGPLIGTWYDQTTL